MSDHRSRVTIISVACWDYQHLSPLTGPETDLENIRAVLIEDENVALFSRRKYTELVNPTSDVFRKAINDYVDSLGAENDILLLYFSGHGAAIGSSDFAFCTIDTKPLEGRNYILPMSAVKFSDILSTLWLKKVIPLVIIDACYSGAAGGNSRVNLDELVDDLKGEIQRRYAGNYAILCSGPSDREIRDNIDGNGGFFSYSMAEIARNGINNPHIRNSTIYLREVYDSLRQMAEQSPNDQYPMLFVGPTLPEISFFKNVAYRPLEYRLVPHLVSVLKVLWDDGQMRALKPGEIAFFTGRTGTFGNQNKLSLTPWQLVEDVPHSRPRQRRLSERGIAFMRGNLALPRDIVFDQTTKGFIVKPDSVLVTIDDFA